MNQFAITFEIWVTMMAFIGTGKIPLPQPRPAFFINMKKAIRNRVTGPFEFSSEAVLK